MELITNHWAEVSDLTVSLKWSCGKCSVCLTETRSGWTWATWGGSYCGDTISSQYDIITIRYCHDTILSQYDFITIRYYHDTILSRYYHGVVFITIRYYHDTWVSIRFYCDIRNITICWVIFHLIQLATDVISNVEQDQPQVGGANHLDQLGWRSCC